MKLETGARWFAKFGIGNKLIIGSIGLEANKASNYRFNCLTSRVILIICALPGEILMTSSRSLDLFEADACLRESEVNQPQKQLRLNRLWKFPRTFFPWAIPEKISLFWAFSRDC
jgi:hypothetical protein